MNIFKERIKKKKMMWGEKLVVVDLGLLFLLGSSHGEGSAV